MPILQYKCKKCGKKFEELVRSHTDQVVCPDCGGETETKGIIFLFPRARTLLYKELQISLCVRTVFIGVSDQRRKLCRKIDVREGRRRFVPVRSAEKSTGNLLKKLKNLKKAKKTLDFMSEKCYYV